MTPAPVPSLVDTHAHLQDPQFGADLEQVLSRAREAGVRAMVCVGYDVDSSRKAVELANRHDAIFAAVGVHPNYAGRAAAADWAEISRLARLPGVVGIGETGLDNYRDFTPPDVQEAWLGRHLRLAAELALPVVVHNRQADARTRELLGAWARDLRWRRPPGVLHCFGGDRQTLESCLEAGFFISIAGPATYKKSDELRSAAEAIPVGRLVVETDCPYLAPHPLRGKRNEPAFLVHTAQRLAEVRGESYASLAEHTTAAARMLFQIGQGSRVEPGVIAT